MIHKGGGHKGVFCGEFKTGDDVARLWRKVNCPACYRKKWKHSNPRMKKYRQKKKEREEEAEAKLLGEDVESY